MQARLLPNIKKPECYNPNLFHHVFLALYLLTESKNKKEDPAYKSTHKEYMDIIPTELNHLPAYFNKEEMDLLKGTDIVEPNCKTVG